MMPELLHLAAVIIFIIFAGWNILFLIFRGKVNLHFLEKLFLSYGAGIGFISLEMLVLYLFRAKYTLFNMIAPWLSIVFINAILLFGARSGKDDAKPSREKLRRKHTAFALCLFLGIAFETIYAFFRALIKPIEAYDAVAIYAIKSKIFYLAKSIPSDYFTALANHFPHPDYPLNIPLIQTFIYLCLGNLNDQLVKIIFPLYFTGILVFLYFSIRQFAGSAYALLFTFILATIPQFNAYASNAYLDLPLAYYCFISAVFLFEWFKHREHSSLLAVSVIMAALAGWTKNEGLIYCGVFILTLASFFIANIKKITVRDRAAIFLCAGIIFIVLMPWLLTKYSAHLVNTDIGEIRLNPLYLVKQLYKIGPILYEFQKQMLGPKKWNIFWIAMLVALIFRFKKAFEHDLRYISIMLALIVCSYIYFYLISPLDIGYFLGKTWSRFLLHFLPLAVYWLAIILKEDIKI